MSVREPVSRRGGPVRPALSRAAIVEAALAVADRQGLDAVSMRRVADELETGASALYVYIQNRDDLLEAMFDHAMAGVARAELPEGDWRERLSWLLLESISTASGHGGLARVALTSVPAGPNAIAMTGRVRTLLAEGGLDEATIPAALDLLALFVIGAALDRVPVADPEQHRQRLHWEIDVILTGLIATGRKATSLEPSASAAWTHKMPSSSIREAGGESEMGQHAVAEARHDADPGAGEGKYQ